MSTDDIKKRIAADAADAKRVFDLARAQPFLCNENYRLVYLDRKHTKRDDTLTLLKFAETVNATNADVRQWYAIGETCRDRPGVLAVFHPLIHKQEAAWEWICNTAIALAKDLKRWVWVTLGEDRWARIVLGDDPRGEDDGSRARRCSARTGDSK